MWDGGCRFCRWWMAWVRARDRARRIADVPCGSAEQRAALPSIAPAACLESVLAVRADGTIFRAAGAIAQVLRRLPRWRVLGAAIDLPGLRWAVAAGYRVVARLRRFL